MANLLPAPACENPAMRLWLAVLALTACSKTEKKAGFTQDETERFELTVAKGDRWATLASSRICDTCLELRAGGKDIETRSARDDEHPEVSYVTVVLRREAD